MKKLFALLLSVLLLLSLFGCSGSGETGNPEGTPSEGSAEVADTLPTVLNQSEYVLYQNVFFSDAADDYLNKTATKEGTFTWLYDAFNQRTRYYVWGYMDATKCCDWQWEFVPKDPDKLPANGSLVKMTGTMVRDEAALDNIWFIDAELELKTAYESTPCDVDMTTMDATLERVQLLNMQYKPDAFKGQTLRIYGRIASLDSIQHPYYDGAWNQKFVTEAEVPAMGTMVILTGTWQGDTIQAGKVETTKDY